MIVAINGEGNSCEMNVRLFEDCALIVSFE